MNRSEKQLFAVSLLILFSFVDKMFPIDKKMSQQISKQKVVEKVAPVKKVLSEKVPLTKKLSSDQKLVAVKKKHAKKKEAVKLPEPTKEEEDKAMRAFVKWMQKTPFKFKFSGAIRLDAFFDSRQGWDYWQGLDFNSPKQRRLDPNGCDIEDKAQFTIVPWPLMQVDIFGPDVWGAKSSALLKADITGKTLDVTADQVIDTYRTPRVKHAYFQLDWEKTSLRSGLYYHPLAMVELAPDTVSVNGGEMFDPFQYSVMFQLRHKFSAFELVTALGRTAYLEKARDAITPHFYLRLNAFIGDQMICVGNDFRGIVPRLQTDPALATSITDGTVGYKEDEVILGFVPFVAARFKKGKFLFKTRLTYAENGLHYDLIGGYAVCARDAATDRRRYTRLRSLSYWIDTMHTTEKREIGVFFGYAKNLGSRHKIQRDPDGNLMITGWLVDADHMVRIQPRVRIFRGPVTVGVELEYTCASYGTTNDCGRVNDGCPVGHTRLLASFIYAF